MSDAAVLGQSFTLAGLAAVSGITESELELRVTGLVRRELLRFEADPRSPERGQYAFVQALIREVAYNTLAKRDRKVRHLAAARFFEALGSDELAGALAGHYLAAHACADGEEADALAAQARVTLRAAADRASALGSHIQALAFLDQALAVTSEPGARAELLEQAGTAAGAANRTERARPALEEAVALHHERGDRLGACRATTELVRLLLTTTSRDRAMTFIEAAVGEFADLAEDPAGVALRSQLARGQFLTGRQAESIVTADGILPVAERLDLVPIIADLLVTKGSALNSVGRLREGAGVLETGRLLAESVGLSFTVLRATLNSMSPAAADNPAACVDTCLRGIELAGRLGQAGFQLVFRETLGYMAYAAGEWDLAVTALREGLEVLPEADAVHMSGGLDSYAALRGEASGPLLAGLRTALGDETDPMTTAHYALLQAFAALADGDVALIREAIGWLEDNFPDGLDGFSWGTLARTALWSGDGDTARTALERLRDGAVRGRFARRARAARSLRASPRSRAAWTRLASGIASRSAP